MPEAGRRPGLRDEVERWHDTHLRLAESAWAAGLTSPPRTRR